MLGRGSSSVPTKAYLQTERAVKKQINSSLCYQVLQRGMPRAMWQRALEGGKCPVELVAPLRCAIGGESRPMRTGTHAGMLGRGCSAKKGERTQSRLKGQESIVCFSLNGKQPSADSALGGHLDPLWFPLTSTALGSYLPVALHLPNLMPQA